MRDPLRLTELRLPRGSGATRSLRRPPATTLHDRCRSIWSCRRSLSSAPGSEAMMRRMVMRRVPHVDGLGVGGHGGFGRHADCGLLERRMALRTASHPRMLIFRSLVDARLGPRACGVGEYERVGALCFAARWASACWFDQVTVGGSRASVEPELATVAAAAGTTSRGCSEAAAAALFDGAGAAPRA